jgi:hypothetical protein
MKQHCIGQVYLLDAMDKEKRQKETYKEFVILRHFFEHGGYS